MELGNGNAPLFAVRSGNCCSVTSTLHPFFPLPLSGLDGKPRAELFVGDRLHNNRAGYKLRAQIVRQVVDRLSASR